MKKLFAALAVAVSIVVSPALAADSDASDAASSRRDYYVGFRVAKTGLNLATEEATSNTEWDDRWVWPIGLGGVIGHRFNKNVRMDLEFDYMNAATRDESMKIRATSALTNIYWVYNIRADYVQSYLGAGLGVANLRAKADAPLGNAAADWMFGYQIAVGFNLMLNEYLNVDVGARYKDLGYAKHQSAPLKFYTDAFAWQLYAGMVFKW